MNKNIFLLLLLSFFLVATACAKGNTMPQGIADDHTALIGGTRQTIQ